MERSLFNIFRRNRPLPAEIPAPEPEQPAAIEPLGLLYSKGSFSPNAAMNLSAVYRCVNCISDAVAQLPLEIFRIDSKGYKKKDRKNPLAKILGARPNGRMTRYTFISLLVQSMILKGNGYAYIKRADGKVEQLVFVPSDYVTINEPKTLFEPVSYKVAGISDNVSPSDMIHLVNQSSDGISGISTIKHAFRSLELAHDSERHAANFFGSGCSVGGILKAKTTLNDRQKKEAKEAWRAAHSSRGGEPGGVAVMPVEMDFQPVKINAKDAQLLETREFNVVDICRFFGVSPVKVFDLSKSSYSTVEATNIGFLTDTVSPLLEKIELEFETKLFPGEDIDVRFDVSQLLRADKQSLAAYYSTMFQIGAISPNEIRRDIDLPSVKGGDSNYIQVNMQPIEKAGTLTDPIPDNNNNQMKDGES